MENWKNLFKPESIFYFTVGLIVILTAYVYFTVNFANESSIRRAELTLDIVPIFLTIALTLVVLSSQWARSEEKKKQQKEEKIQKTRELLSLEVKANLKMFERVGASKIKFKLLDEILKLIINSGDIIHLEQDLQDDIMNFRPEISLFNQTVLTSAGVSTTTRKNVLEALEKFSIKLDERIKQL